eukprot:2094544-Prymnesium_polylepis.1
MCRKLALSTSAVAQTAAFCTCSPLIVVCTTSVLAAGWVLLIDGDSELARLIVALSVSFASLALNMAIRPFKRIEDTAMMAVIEVALIFAYTCVLLIKTCDVSPDLCKMYGLGDTASGRHWQTPNPGDIPLS